MAVTKKVVKAINNAQVASAATYPTAPYQGKLPKGNVKKGTKGQKDVKAVQTFLNWCIKAGLVVDGVCGKKTVSAIKRFQKQYKLKVDGVFGPQCRTKAKAIIKKYEPKPTPTPKPTTWVDKANAWAKEKAADNSYHYKIWTRNEKTHECPVCHNYPKGTFHGWNCIGFVAAVWHHGGGLKNNCNCYVISNDTGNRMYKMSGADMLKLAQERTGLKNIKVIRNKNGISKALWQPGDWCLQFSGSTYVHSFYYMGNGKVVDAIGSNGKVANDKQIAVRDYTKYSAKIIIRYTGK